MIPVNNSSDSHGCSNTSSNCVIWQGPDISCINLCTGDSVSDVVAKIAEKLCALPATCASSTDIDISGLTLDCVLPDGQPAPSNIVEVAQRIITYVCALPTSSGTTYTPPTFTLCQELYNAYTTYYPSHVGDPPATLGLEDFANYLGKVICAHITTIATIQGDVTTLNTNLTNLTNRVTALENAAGPTMNPDSCLGMGSSAVAISSVVGELTTQFCDFRNKVGSATLITNAINAQCFNGFSQRLSGSGTYSSETNWIGNSTTLSHAVQNLWVVVCDMYNAVANIQTNCCPGGCDAITYAYTSTLTRTSTGLPNNIVLDFSGSTVPGAFNDCTSSSQVTITDGLGVSTSSTFSIASYQNNSSGLTLGVGSLFPAGNFQVAVDFCTTDGSTNCSEVITQSVTSGVICPQSYTAVANGATQIDISFINRLELAYTINNVSQPTTYGFTLKDGNGAIVSSVSINSGTSSGATSSVSALTALTKDSAYTFSFLGLGSTLAAQTYTIQLQVVLGGTTYNVNCTDLTVELPINCIIYNLTGNTDNSEPLTFTYTPCGSSSTTTEQVAGNSGGPANTATICVAAGTTVTDDGTGNGSALATTNLCTP